MAEEAGPVVGGCAGEGELREVCDVDDEGRCEGETGAAGRIWWWWWWRRRRRGCGRVRCGAEGVEGAAVDADAEERFARATAVEDDVVAGGLAGCEVGCLEVELRYGAEWGGGAAAGRVQVHRGVLRRVEEEDEACGVQLGCVEVLEEFYGSVEVVDDPDLEPVELAQATERDGRARGAFVGVRDGVEEGEVLQVRGGCEAREERVEVDGALCEREGADGRREVRVEREAGAERQLAEEARGEEGLGGERAVPAVVSESVLAHADGEVLEGGQGQISVVLGEEGVEVVRAVAVDVHVQPADARGVRLDDCAEGREAAVVVVVFVVVAVVVVVVVVVVAAVVVVVVVLGYTAVAHIDGERKVEGHVPRTLEEAEGRDRVVLFADDGPEGGRAQSDVSPFLADVRGGDDAGAAA